jgi:DNA (cytosine-5)-methyltransferase 1
LSNDEVVILDAWDNLVTEMLIHRDGLRLPGFPLWSDLWGKKPIYQKDKKAPDWKKDFEAKNEQFYDEHKKIIDQWLSKHPEIRSTTPSKRKLEWQAQDMKSLWDGLIHFRPSGIRVKRPTYVPALVAITQTSIIGKKKRRISIEEAAHLQGLPTWFSFENQKESATFKQLGNGVNVAAVWYVLKQISSTYNQILNETAPNVLKSIISAPDSPDEIINKL